MAASKSQSESHRGDLPSGGEDAWRDVSPTPEPRPSTSAQPPQSELPPPINDFMAQRRILEKERLARIARMQAATGSQTQKRPHSASMSEDEDEEDEMSRPAKKKTPPTRTQSTSRANNGSSKAERGEMFWNGELRSTANRYTEASDKKPTFRISEIIGDVRVILGLLLVATDIVQLSRNLPYPLLFSRRIQTWCLGCTLSSSPR